MLPALAPDSSNDGRKRAAMKGLAIVATVLVVFAVVSLQNSSPAHHSKQVAQFIANTQADSDARLDHARLDCIASLTNDASVIDPAKLDNLASQIAITPDAIFAFTDSNGKPQTLAWKEGVAQRGARLNWGMLKKDHKLVPESADLRVVYSDNTVVTADLDECALTGYYEPTQDGGMDPRVIAQVDESEQNDDHEADNIEDEIREPFVKEDIAYGTHPKNTKRFPWTVRVGTPGRSGRPGRGFCSGEIISRYFVVTSKHCTRNRRHNGLEIIAGTHKIRRSRHRQIRRSQFIWRHPREDIALVRVSRAFTYNNRVNKVPRFMGYKNNRMLVFASGFGAERKPGPMSNKFKFAYMFTKSDRWCKNHRSSFAKGKEVCCNGGSGNTCGGDSGGPLVYYRYEKYNLLGINSWSHTSCNNKRGNVDVFESMVYLRGWVLNTMGRNYGWSNVVVHRRICTQARWRRVGPRKYRRVGVVRVRCVSRS